MEKRHIISILVENKFGVLARVAGLFSGRGYNIESLTVNSTDKHDVSMMTIVTYGDDRIIEQIIKQLRKLINVLKVRDLTSYNHIERELGILGKCCFKRGRERDVGRLLRAKFHG